ncbi:MAG TPA: hypothetical protein VGK45_03505 [Thermoanaerobaculia bacterium]|jgi:hypothetical protein
MRHRVVIAGILAVLLSAASAQAGWLVLRTGVSFETVGGWKVQDNWLNFTDKATGQRKAVMVVTVDLDATKEALLTGAPPKVEARKPGATTVIDDKTIHNPSTLTARRQRALSQVIGGLNMISYCLNAYSDNEKKFDECVKNLKL